MDAGRERAELLRGLYEAWAASRGAENPFLPHIAETVAWHSLADGARGLEFSARITCKSDVLRYFERLGQDWSMDHCTVEDVLVDGDRAVVICHCGWTNRHTGKSVSTPKADVLVFDGGTIVKVTEFYDTAGAIAAATP